MISIYNPVQNYRKHFNNDQNFVFAEDEIVVSLKYMRGLQSILFCAGIILLLVGNIGFMVFEHNCDKDGRSFSFVIDDEDRCGHHKQMKEGCTQEEKCSEQCLDHRVTNTGCESPLGDDCCDDNWYHVKVSLDYYQEAPSTDAILLLAPVLSPIQAMSVPIATSEHSIPGNRPPPLPEDVRRSMLQVWLV